MVPHFKILKFTATWCHPCQKIIKLCEAEVEKNEFESIFETVDYDSDCDASVKCVNEHKIKQLPTLLFLKDNIVVFRVESSDNGRISDAFSEFKKIVDASPNACHLGCGVFL